MMNDDWYTVRPGLCSAHPVMAQLLLLLSLMCLVGLPFLPVDRLLGVPCSSTSCTASHFLHVIPEVSI